MSNDQEPNTGIAQEPNTKQEPNTGIVKVQEDEVMGDENNDEAIQEPNTI